MLLFHTIGPTLFIRPFLVVRGQEILRLNRPTAKAEQSIKLELKSRMEKEDNKFVIIYHKTMYAFVKFKL